MNGVIILSLKKPSYYCSAANLAMSIKSHNKNIHITLVSDGGHNEHYRAEHYSYFDSIKEINKDHYTDDYGFSPALAKINIFRYSEYENTLYIDADSLVLRDIQPLIDRLVSLKGNFYSNVLGSGYKNDEIIYQAWATNEKLWDYFKLKENQKVYTFNTSWFFFRKSTENLFKITYNNYFGGFSKLDLKNKWGGSLPDELFFYGTLAQKEINPSVEFSVCFFGDKIDSRTLDQLANDYYMFTLYGGKSTVRLNYIEWYDRICQSICNSNGVNNYFKSHEILKGKHVHEQ